MFFVHEFGWFAAFARSRGRAPSCGQWDGFTAPLSEIDVVRAIERLGVDALLSSVYHVIDARALIAVLPSTGKTRMILILSLFFKNTK